MRKLLIVLFCLLGIALANTWAQSINTEFGKNRVQYTDDFERWWMYETENFITYWYGKGRNIAQFVIQMAEFDHEEIQNVMEHRINDKIEIIVYIDLADLKQSNMGTTETFEGVAGETTVIGNKMFVYFDGNHKNLRQQIRKGIANAYLNAMYSRTSLQEIVANSQSLNLPEWYAQGIVEFQGSNWNHLAEDELRDLWLRKKPNFKNFKRLSADHPRIAGHSFWHFIDATYGKSTLSNILYLTRLNRNLDNNLLFILGITFKELIGEWRSFYNDLYAKENDQFEDENKAQVLNLSNKSHIPISDLKLSPNGKFVAFAQNQVGKVKVKIHNIETGEEINIFKKGSKNEIQETDFNYPILAWHPSGEEISIVYNFRNKIYLRKVFLETGEMVEQFLPEDIQRVYSMSYINDLDYMFSATNDGYSDLFVYYSQGRQYKKLTEDFYDDIDAQYVSIDGTSGILFSSNRMGTTLEKEKIDTILPIDNYNSYFMPFSEDESGALIQLTKTPYENERFPYLAENGKITYLSSNSGMQNRHVFDAIEGTQYINSNKSRNIIRHHALPNHDTYVYTLYNEGKYVTYIETPDWNRPVTPYFTDYAKTLKSYESLKSDPKFGVLQLEDEVEEKENIKPGYLFDTEFEDPQELPSVKIESSEDQLFEELLLLNPTNSNSKSDKKVIEFISARAVAARTKFKLESFTTQMDNSVLFEGLRSFADDESELAGAPMGLLMKGVVTDLFEDYRIEGGIRLPTTFNGLETYLVLDDNKNLIDRRFAFYRRAETNTVPSQSFPVQKSKSTTFLGLFRAKYPLDVYTSFRATTSLRFDRFGLLNSDEISSSQNVENEKRLSLRLEYVFDNTIRKGENLLFGTRYKVYAEAINRFEISFGNDQNTFDPSRGFTGLLGADARHYLPFLRHSILALRGAAATSIGSDRILYYVGGVENWMFNQFNNDIGTPSDRTFAYQVLAPHLRGFKYNIRNGSTFVLANTEARIPIFKYFSQGDLRSSFLRNFMLVGFFDIGTAWHGLTPGSADNPINTTTISQPPSLQINVRYFRDPLVLGYGAGVRANLFGYFIRLDYAWGIESRSVQDPRLYFAIGKDF